MSGSRTPTLGRPRTSTDPELIDRLARLRAILPLMAADLAAARRRAHALELENRRLARRVAELESTLACTSIPARRMAPDTSRGRRVRSEPTGL
jgi:hypothetical protein